MPVFTFESRYRDGGGSRFDVCVAPNREIALRMAARNIIEENGWHEAIDDIAYCETSSSLIDFFNEEMEIMGEWTGLNGSACPNCTSHGGKTYGTMYGTDGMLVDLYHCDQCGFDWAPLGKRYTGPELSENELNAELNTWEAEHMNKEDAE